MTLRSILGILSFCLISSINAQFYRVFFNDKGEDVLADTDLPVNARYLSIIDEYCDSIHMKSRWLNYALIESHAYPSALLDLSFVKKIEVVVPLQAISLQEEGEDWFTNPAKVNSNRQWQLDTMGYQTFHQNGITGNGVVIAIIDAGFNNANTSKAFTDIFSSGRVLKTWDFIDGDTNVFHGSSHGTMVWSCIAGNLPEKQTGLATGSSFILLRSEDANKETMADEDRWIQAIEMAYDLGADIVNSSVGFTNLLHKQTDLNGSTLISQAANIAAQKGMLVVISAGNEWLTNWKTISVPADAEGVISVGAIDLHGNHAYFSSVGPTADGRLKPDVVAPGVCVAVNGNELTTVNGTSFAAPLVAGYLACMLEWKGKFTKDSLIHYSGLYPYFDYVFGYGVPYSDDFSIAEGIFGPTEIFEVDKLNATVKTIPLSSNGKKSIKFFAYIKIEDKNGRIKFSKKLKLSRSGTCKIPITRKPRAFHYDKLSDPEESNKWTIRWYFWSQDF